MADDVNRGVIYVAFGASAEAEARKSIASLRRFHDWPIAAAAPRDLNVPEVEHIPVLRTNPDNALMARVAKTSLWHVAPKEWEQVLFLDADTRVKEDISFGFKALSDGWEFVMVSRPVPLHKTRTLWHVSEEERNYTFETIGNPQPLMLNSGVMFFRRTERVKRFFLHWRLEWEMFRGKDQGALLRALWKYPVSMLILGQPYNGGEVIEHLQGRAARI